VFGLELDRKADKTYAAFSTLGCVALNPTGDKKDPLGFVETMRRGTNATSASFAGAEQDGAIVLHAVENIGVSEALQGCEITAMTLRPFADSALSVKLAGKAKAARLPGR